MTVIIDVVSDVICPWCFLGKRHLDMAIASLDNAAVEVRWRAFLLDASIPKEGMDRKAYVTAKFGAERLNSDFPRPLGARAGPIAWQASLRSLRKLGCIAMGGRGGSGLAIEAPDPPHPPRLRLGPAFAPTGRRKVRMRRSPYAASLTSVCMS
jgi:hypothetical protein